MDLTFAQALWTLGILPTEDLPSVALQVLQDGKGNKDFAALAGLSIAERDEAATLFRAGLTSSGLTEMTKDEALRAYAREIAREIVRGKHDPYAGAKAIWRAVLASDLRTHDFDPFIYAASEYEERPSDRPLFRSEILREAQALVDR